MLDRLPDDMLVVILERLAWRDLMHVAHTSRALRRVAKGVRAPAPRGERPTRPAEVADALRLCPWTPELTLEMGGYGRFNGEDLAGLRAATHARFYKRPANSAALKAAAEQCRSVMLFESRRLPKSLAPLTRVREVTICCVDALVDVSALAGVHTLTLLALDRVTEVGALGTVHSLTLNAMSQISDVGALGTVHTLTLCFLPLVSDVSALATVHALEMWNMGVGDVSTLGRVHSLTLGTMPRVRSVAGLGAVHTLVLSHVHQVRDLSPLLGGPCVVSLGDMEGVVDLSPLQHAHTLILSDHRPEREFDLSALDRVRTIHIIGRDSKYRPRTRRVNCHTGKCRSRKILRGGACCDFEIKQS